MALSMRTHHIVFLSLVTAVTTSCSSPPDPHDPQVREAPMYGIPSPSPSPTAPTTSPSPQPRTPLAVVLAATQGPGVALLDTQGNLLERQATALPVSDIEFDPVSQRWIVVEYDDDSANQISAWTLSRQGDSLHLEQTATQSTEGLCRVFATPQGVVLMEDDGLRSRWSLLDTDLETMRWRTRAPIPSSFFPEDPATSTRIGIVQLDDPSGPIVKLTRWDLTSAALVESSGEVMSSPWSTLDSVRACALSPGRFAIARVQEAALRFGILSSTEPSATNPVAIALSATGSVVDIACDEQRGDAFVLLSGASQASVVRIAEDGSVSRWAGAIPRSLDRGPRPSRRLELLRALGVVLVGGEDSVAAFKAEDGTSSWRRDDVRWPLRVAELL